MNELTDALARTMIRERIARAAEPRISRRRHR